MTPGQERGERETKKIEKERELERREERKERLHVWLQQSFGRGARRVCEVAS